MTVTYKSSMITIERGRDEYPSALERLSDPPARLLVIGTLKEGPSVALVGSRNADAGAIRFTFALAETLARQGVGVISGGALGIDTAAHRGALASGGHTVAVLGSGFDYMYPPENESLFEQIGALGALVTEFDPPQPPTRWTFPKRNRIVAAMADAVVVTQAKERSGALITAIIARELGVPVGAVPGVPGDPRGRGGNGLLKGGAVLVEDAEDVLRLIARPRIVRQPNLPGIAAKRLQVAPPSNLSKTETEVLNYLSTSPLHIDDITAGLRLSAAETGSVILALELQGLVEDRGGKHFVRVG